MMKREYTWSSIFAWGLTLSGATLATGGVIGMFWQQAGIGWLCIGAFAGMMAFGIGLVNCSAAGALQALKHRKPDGRQIEWAVFAPALASCMGFVFATNVGVHLGWDIVAANAPEDAHLPSAFTVDAVFYIFAFAKPAMAWIVEGRKAMDAETWAARQAQRLQDAADLAAAQAVRAAVRVEPARMEAEPAEPAPAMTSAPTPAAEIAASSAEARPRASRRPKTQEELREAARRAVARRAAAFRDQNMAPVQVVETAEPARHETLLTPLQIAKACDTLKQRGETPTFARLAEMLNVPRERVEATWPKGVPLDGTGEKIRAA